MGVRLPVGQVRSEGLFIFVVVLDGEVFPMVSASSPFTTFFQGLVHCFRVFYLTERTSLAHVFDGIAHTANTLILGNILHGIRELPLIAIVGVEEMKDGIVLIHSGYCGSQRSIADLPFWGFTRHLS